MINMAKDAAMDILERRVKEAEIKNCRPFEAASDGS